MTKRIYSNKRKKQVNIYAEGEWLKKSQEAWQNAGGKNLGSTLSSVSGSLGTIASGAMDNAKLADTSGIEASINARSSFNPNAATNEDLLNIWSNYSDVSSGYTMDDMRGTTAGQRAMNTISGTLSGASTGAQIGGLFGGIAGGVVGLGSNLAGIFVGREKARKKALELNQKTEAANERAYNNLVNNAENIEEQNDLIALANSLSNGGPIYIKPSKRGTFTREAQERGLGVQEFANKVLSNPDNYTEIMRRKAQFAKNANAWKHSFGGDLHTNGSTWDNGLSIIGNGSTHENNPYEGVQVGVDEEGVPNLVEEGEVIWNDYVFSNRLKVPKAIRTKYSLKKNKDISFAEAVKELSKESEERPNDPISKRGLESNLINLVMDQETLRMKKEKNKNTNKNKFPNGGPTYGEDGLAIEEPILEDDIALRRAVRDIRFRDKLDSFDFGNIARYAPVFGSATAVLSDAFGASNKPDYSNPQMVRDAYNAVPTTTYRPLTNYLTYKPFDINYATNKLNAQAGATRRAIMDTNNPARNAALLAADYNALNQLGDLAVKADEYNLKQRQLVEDFNRKTDAINAETAYKVSKDAFERGKLGIEAALKEAAMRESIDQAASVAKSANLSNLFTNLGKVGEDTQNRKDALSVAPYLATYSREFLKSQGYSDAEIDEIFKGKKANGGKIKRKKGLTV